MTAVLTFEATLRQEQRVSPETLAYAELLALPTGELESVIESEVEQNPALERAGSCPLCGEPGSPCGCRLRSRRVPAPSAGLDRLDTAIADQPTAADALLADLRPLVDAADLPVLAYVIGCLDHHGFLEVTPREAAAQLGVPTTRVERVTELLRAHGPTGVGATDLRDCLLLQLDRLDDAGGGDPLARRIIDGHLPALAAGSWSALARAVGASRAEIERAAAFIRSRLRPYPSFDSPASGRVAPAAVPDVIIHEREPGVFSVQLVEPERLNLVISPGFADHVAEAQARSFLSRLERRWQTIGAVAEVVVRRQRDYLAYGPRHMGRLTRGEVAAELGVHESTVSRATHGRYVLLPGGRVVSFGHFFQTAPGPCEALAQLIADEDQPRSDAALAAELTRLGFPLARRTVAKYRDRLGIPRHTER